jgi:hypothetical protein
VSFAACGAVAVPAASASGSPVAVVVVPAFAPAHYADRGAVGLFVPGAGATVSGERARASLVRGRVVSSLVSLDGKIVLRLARAPAATTIYVALPPPGSHDNTVRYPIAIVGAGYHGVLRSASTKIDGLVSLADIAPTAAALAVDATPPIRARPTSDAAAILVRLDTRLARAHDARTGVTLVLAAWLVIFAAVGLLTRSAVAGRAGVLAAPVALTTAVALRAAGIDRPWHVTVLIAAATGAGAVLVALRPEPFVPAVVAFLLAFFLVLVAWPEVNALSALGPHPDGGGRFYGVTNQVETLLLAPPLAAAAAAGIAGVVAIGSLLFVTVGWSRAGADGGGALVVASAFSVLAVGITRARITPARIVIGAAIVLGAGLALVGIDALLGGSNHVTHAVGGGPSALYDDDVRRLRISWAGATAAPHAVLLCLVSLGGLAWLGVRGRSRPVIMAMVVAIGVSLVVNDTPVDVLVCGALGCLALTAWEETRSSPRSSGSPRPRARQERPGR